ncbi:DUF488 domain-containing protein [Legionella sp. PATHC035]|uniref:DUF488 domain-containing protein n=1 Tax=Legionella sp. PATHC035 TaxID=2992040 RepID=UPI0022431A98|nr:DUF488 domain-containing protein [Legionella sp. PATHC035]MCW8409883.1 DUF488 domain-containing protein [Legionella sp. PATHC035]
MPELFTMGHSTHSLQEFLEIVHAHQMTHLVDVRTIPRSRTVPWFNQEELKKSLEKEKIGYTHLLKLGGLRKVNKHSINSGWRNASFRGFADYMQTAEFLAGLDALNEIIEKEQKVVILCAEAVPWRCHRSLIADAELIRNYAVWDIMNKTTAKPHQLTSFAVVDKEKNPIQIYYP